MISRAELRLDHAAAAASASTWDESEEPQDEGTA